MFTRFRSKNRENPSLTIEVPRINHPSNEEDEEDSEDEDEFQNSDDEFTPKRTDRNQRWSKKPSNTLESVQEDGKSKGIRLFSKVRVPEDTAQCSRFARYHVFLMLILVLHALAWLIGFEVICLFKNFCSLGDASGPTMNLYSVLDPSVPKNGFAFILASGGALVFIATPLIIYLDSTERRRNARFAALVAFLGAAYLFSIGGVFIQRAVTANTEWSVNYIAQRYYGGDEAEATSAAATSNASIAALFMSTGLCLAAVSFYSFWLSRLYPSTVRRLHLLPMTTRHIENSGLKKETEPLIASKLESTSKLGDTNKSSSTKKSTERSDSSIIKQKSERSSRSKMKKSRSSTSKKKIDSDEEEDEDL